ATVPDNDRYVFSLGANYAKNRNLDFDFAYSYIHIADADASYTDDCHPSGYIPSQSNSSAGATPTNQCTGNGGTFKGTFKDTYAHSVGIQMNQRF
ncbi:outer membrane protein transport protein, partial [Amnimonas aquatica]